MARAAARRSATRIRPIRTASGSPNGARCSDLDRHALIDAEIAQPPRVAVRQQRPIDRRHRRAGREIKLIEGKRHRTMMADLRLIINNEIGELAARAARYAAARDSACSDRRDAADGRQSPSDCGPGPSLGKARRPQPRSGLRNRRPKTRLSAIPTLDSDFDRPAADEISALGERRDHPFRCRTRLVAIAAIGDDQEFVAAHPGEDRIPAARSSAAARRPRPAAGRRRHGRACR